MGIDIYAHWNQQTDAEKEAQFTGFSVVHGHVGYLREAYHGGPYATQYLVHEAFDAETRDVQIPAHVLRERLPHTLELVEEREKKIYQSKPGHIRAVKESFTAFVQLCEDKERETGIPCRIHASY